MMNWFIVATVAGAVIMIGGLIIAMVSASKPIIGCKENFGAGMYLLAIGLAGIIWGSLNARVIVIRPLEEYTGPIQTVETGKISSFADGQLTFIKDVVTGEVATFAIPEYIVEQIQEREAIIEGGDQIAALTIVDDNVTEVAIMLNPDSTVSVGTRPADGADVRGATPRWIASIPIAIAIVACAIHISNSARSLEIDHGTLAVAAVVSIFLLSAMVFSTVATRVAATEQYIAGTRAVVTDVGRKTITYVTGANVAQETNLAKEIARQIRPGDKVVINQATAYLFFS